MKREHGYCPHPSPWPYEGTVHTGEYLAFKTYLDPHIKSGEGFAWRFFAKARVATETYHKLNECWLDELIALEIVGPPQADLDLESEAAA